jgi:hypothetical protein
VIFWHAAQTYSIEDESNSPPFSPPICRFRFFSGSRTATVRAGGMQPGVRIVPHAKHAVDRSASRLKSGGDSDR